MTKKGPPMGAGTIVEPPKCPQGPHHGAGTIGAPMTRKGPSMGACRDYVELPIARKGFPMRAGAILGLPLPKAEAIGSPMAEKAPLEPTWPWLGGLGLILSQFATVMQK